MMNEYMIWIGEDTIIIKKSDETVTEQKNMLFHWVAAYILQFASEKIKDSVAARELQNALEEYSYLITNTNDYDKNIVPEAIGKLVENVSLCLKQNTVITIMWKKELVEVDMVELYRILGDVYDDFCSSLVIVPENSHVELDISSEFGDIFSKVCHEKLHENGVTLIKSVKRDKKVVEEIKIYFEDSMIIDSHNNFCIENEVVCGCDLNKGLHLQIHSSLDAFKKEIYLCFPFWKKGDAFQLSLIQEKGKNIIVGKHMDSGIVSKIAL